MDISIEVWYVCAYQNKGVESHEKAIIPAAILCAVLCIGLGKQPSKEAEPTLTPFTPTQVEAGKAPMLKLEIPEAEIEVITPTPVPTPTQIPEPTPTPESTPAAIPVPTPAMASVAPQPVQTGNMIYVEGFGWLESQGEGTVIYDEMMYENRNKVGSMG